MDFIMCEWYGRPYDIDSDELATGESSSHFIAKFG